MRGQGHVFSKVSLKKFPLEVSAYITEKLKKNEISDTELLYQNDTYSSDHSLKPVYHINGITV